ncbi:hypothetical protein BDV12DRAFT_177141 [Aspergillus spectabilis]
MIMPSSSFLFDSPVPPHLDLVGAPSPRFQIPPTPSASSALYRSISISQRKRSYPESGIGHFKVPQTPHRPPPLVNDFFGDLDESSDHEGHDSSFHRPSRYRDYLRTPLDASLTDSGKEPDHFRRKRCRVEDPSLVVAASPSGMDEKTSVPEQTATAVGPLRWSRAVLNVVGKVWDFCWSGPFRGFYAGGGRGYPLEPSQPEVAEVDQNFSPAPYFSRPSSLSMLPPSAEKRAVSVPGEYPLDVGEEALNGNWVIVSPREGATCNNSTRPRSRKCHVPRNRVVHRRTPSKRALASPPQPTFSAPAKPHESPVSVETQRYLAKQRRQEREEDASLRRLNRQLQAMIQEGKQALGTRVEVDDVDMDMED